MCDFSSVLRPPQPGFLETIRKADSCSNRRAVAACDASRMPTGCSARQGLALEVEFRERQPKKLIDILKVLL